MDFLIYVVSLVGRLGLLALATDLLAGHAGRVGMGAIFFAAIGGYGYVLLVGAGCMPMLAVATVMGLAWAISIPLGRAAILEGDQFLLATFALQVGLIDLVHNLAITGGALGLRAPAHPFRMLSAGPAQGLLVISPFLIAVAWLLTRTLGPRHALGRAYWMIRDDDVAAMTDGLPISNLLASGFTLQAVVGAVAGVSWVLCDSYVGPSTFDLGLSITVLTVVFVSGTGGRAWAMFGGAFLVVGMEEVLAFTIYRPQWVGAAQQIIFNVLLVLLLITRPRGVAGPSIEASRGDEVEL